MMRKLITLGIAIILTTSVAMALSFPQAPDADLQKLNGKLGTFPALDAVYEDSIVYDDGAIMWWYGGGSPVKLATIFTPLADFECQGVAFMANGTGSATVSLFADSSGVPYSTPLWSTTVTYATSSAWQFVHIDTLGTYTFLAGEDFWLQWAGGGPPNEIFDATPVIPERSIFQRDAFGPGWNLSPGDNFVRAYGEYTGAVQDVSVDAVEHGGNFFVTNGTSFQITADVTNNGSAAATFDVGCHIYTETPGTPATYTYFDSLAVQNVVSLGAGATTTVTFPSYTWTTDDRYWIEVEAYYDDSNPGNNFADTETQVYTSPPPAVTLRYDDGDSTNIQYSYTSTVGNGWGMKIDPHQGGAYDIASAHVNVSYAAGDEASGLRILDDAAGTPGTILWETTTVMADGWNDFDCNLTGVTGPVYLIYIYTNGANSSSAGASGYPNSGERWWLDTGVYNPDPANDDVAVRLTLGTAAAYPDFTVILTYNYGSPVPAGGGAINLDAFLQNNEVTSQNFDLWIEIPPQVTPPSVPNRNLTFPGGFSIDRDDMNWPIAASWPAGAYWMEWYIGDLATLTAWASDSFPFVKSADDDGSGYALWEIDGDPLDQLFEGLDLGEMVVSEFALLGSYPNPFNPSATISYTLGSSDRVKLSVYDLSGREVATLVNGYRDAGPHEAHFDASSLASGVYIYRLTSGANTASGKMVLMK